MDMELFKEDLIGFGLELGFASLKIGKAEPFIDWEEMRKTTKQKDPYSSHLWQGMDFNPKKLMGQAQSIIVAAWPYKTYKGDFPRGVAEFSSYYREYPRGRKAIIKLGNYLESYGFEAIINPLLPAKALAHRAGLGYYRKNGLIYIEDIGSFISLHYILTDARLPQYKSMGKVSSCGDCVLCIKACPTGAIEKEGGVIPSRCIRYHMLSSDFVPLNTRDKLGNRLLGCDICQKVCPFNRRAIKNNIPVPKELGLFNILEVLEGWPKGLKKKMDAMGQIIGKNYARAQRVLSTMAILAGNSKDSTYTKALMGLLKHPHAPVRGHSAWALGKIGDPNSIKALERALERERDSTVINEIKEAIQRLSLENITK